LRDDFWCGALAMVTLKEILSSSLSEKQLQHLTTSYDVIGDIIILEIKDELSKKEKMIANALLDMHKNVKVVCKRVGIHTGKYRKQKVKVIAGEKRKTTIHKELNTRLKVHVENVYFSPRMSSERKRIMDQINPGEKILVMFSGCAPYPCVFAKNTKAKEIVGVEINPQGHELALENVALNKLYNVRLYLGDVRKVIPKLKEKFDRICMPLPKGGEDFLDIALGAAKKNAIIHFYDFLHESEFEEASQKISDACDTAGRTCKIISLTKCGQHAPRVFRICVDFQVLN